ncbi:Ubiquinone/menaquinone biosynthesis C-methylase UbiE [Nocardioides scoriae]|uniref:Ubiquinone/menaquinone biosynthesis C-methylase UbiE n=1 Tax=Nocardioides scoriae TaxID=642780 RepID=A0A1H1SGN9_9ACTN|nr:class I SAM-dependent methyltransferase [Nocardioides scoriae]SDS47112.1 Ubiquinone/menaquinone biosynthesis C-methylase UbiE [Nocardioides scoriae]
MTTATTPHAASVPAAFDEVAPTYDLMVALNPGYHSQLRASADVLVSQLPRPAGRPVRVADLGCGSGASTRALERALVAAGLDYEIIGVDGSAGMLEQARRKSWQGQVHFAQDDAEQLDPSTWDRAHLAGDGVLDGVFAAYLVRNVDRRDELLAGIVRLLVPGGAVVIHEYSVKESRVGRRVWDAVSWGVVVPLGLLTAPRSPIYRYLWRSVVDMDGTRELRSRMVAAGLVDVRSRSFGGWQRGVLHTFLGRTPR